MKTLHREQHILEAVKRVVERWNESPAAQSGLPKLVVPFDEVLDDPHAPSDEPWYQIVVRPERPDAHSFEYYGILSKLEEELQEEEHLNVLLLPVFAG